LFVAAVAAVAAVAVETKGSFFLCTQEKERLGIGVLLERVSGLIQNGLHVSLFLIE